jgi:hypothetical protein
LAVRVSCSSAKRRAKQSRSRSAEHRQITRLAFERRYPRHRLKAQAPLPQEGSGAFFFCGGAPHGLEVQKDDEAIGMSTTRAARNGQAVSDSTTRAIAPRTPVSMKIYEDSGHLPHYPLS